jgi:ABC-2 type transport system permease protein
MAVYRRVYHPFEGGLSPVGRRWLVLLRYALRDLFASRLFVMFLVLCFVPILVEAAIIWVVHSPTAQALLHIGSGSGSGSLLPIDARFFHFALAMQGGLALFLAASIGPTLVAPDLADGALALYLGRPLSRTAYVAGKTGALLAVLSLVTWVPVLALYFLQAGLEGGGWIAGHLMLPVAIVLSAALWIALLAFLSVALSAWVRWRLAATGLFFAVFFVGSGMGEIVNLILKTRWGWVLNLNRLIELVWRGLFGLPRADGLPLVAAWGSLLATCCFCLWILDRRLRAREVVR